jgi:hypothetical protein
VAGQSIPGGELQTRPPPFPFLKRTIGQGPTHWLDAALDEAPSALTAADAEPLAPKAPIPMAAITSAVTLRRLILSAPFRPATPSTRSGL